MNVTSSEHKPRGTVSLKFRTARFFSVLVSLSNPSIKPQSPRGPGTSAWFLSSLFCRVEEWGAGSLSGELTRNEMVLNADTFFPASNTPGSIRIFPVVFTSFHLPVIYHGDASLND
jgi:hypothetical protein